MGSVASLYENINNGGVSQWFRIKFDRTQLHGQLRVWSFFRPIETYGDSPIVNNHCSVFIRLLNMAVSGLFLLFVKF